MKKSNLLAAVVLGLAIVLPSLALAQDTSSGCGLGWMVTQRQSLVSSAIRASTNATFFDTVAMTFGTSGCARHDIVLNEKKAIHYAEANYNTLMTEMAEGHGEFLTAFAEVLGCDAGASGAFGQLTQSHYAEIFSTTSTPETMLNGTLAVINANPELALRCRSSSVLARN